MLSLLSYRIPLLRVNSRLLYFQYICMIYFIACRKIANRCNFCPFIPYSNFNVITWFFMIYLFILFITQMCYVPYWLVLRFAAHMVDIPCIPFFFFFLFLDLIYRLPEADFGLVWFGLAKQIGQNRRKRAVAVLPGLPCQGLGYPEQPSRLHTLRTIHTWWATKRRYGKRPARPFSTAPPPAPRIVLDWPYPLHRNSPTTKRVSFFLCPFILSPLRLRWQRPRSKVQLRQKQNTNKYQ